MKTHGIRQPLQQKKPEQRQRYLVEFGGENNREE
jgi:hypothetical protein